MALAEHVKKGGPYTKKEQEERKLQVYHLYFEENKSAAKIAILLNVNRNTINDDIKYWYLQLANDFKVQDLTTKLTKQIQRMEIQRDRLLEDIEEVESLDEKIRLEKLISEIDNRLVQLFSKMISSGIKNLQPTKFEDINEDEIKEFVRDLIFSDEDPYSQDIHSEDNLKYNFIRRKKCDVNIAESVIKKMKQDGLILCEFTDKKILPTFTQERLIEYNIAKFAILRNYISLDEHAKITNKRFELKNQLDHEVEESDKKFIAKYGADQSKWSEETCDEYMMIGVPYSN